MHCAPYVRTAQRRLRRLEALIPVALFMAPWGTGGALAAAVHRRSPVLIALASVALFVSFATLTAWVLTSERRARKPPRHRPWSQAQWRDFELAFWSHVMRPRHSPSRQEPERESR
jgi:hypothetical protein